MKSEIILSDQGDVLFVQNAPFDHIVVRAEFYVESGFLILVYENEDSRMVEYQFQDKSVIDAIVYAPTIILTHVENSELQDGFEVPLIAIQP